jgi:Flp pilus assembly protein TadG
MTAARTGQGLRRWQDERGSGGISLTWLVLTPVILGLIFGGITVGFRMYGENLALDAANAGARAAAVLPVSVDRGRAAAQTFLDKNAAGTLSNTSVSVSISGSDVLVVVTASTPVLPGTITRQASLVMEHLP